MTEEKHIVYDSRWISTVLPDDLKDTIFDTLQAELEPQWSEMSHKGGAVPRLVCIQGDINPETGAQPLYRHPADEQPPLTNWTPMVQRLRDLVSERLQQPINHTLIQCYRTGQDYISQHADKTLDIERQSAVVNLSLGTQRTMILKSKKGNNKDKLASIRVPLSHGSLFVLGWDTNKRMTHQINRDKRANQDKSEEERGVKYKGMRISLTFRTVATFWNPNTDGSLSGQGAPNQKLPRPDSSWKSQEEEELLKAFSIENRTSDYDWEAIYGKGFSVVNFAVTNSNATEQSKKERKQEPKEVS